MASVSSDIIFEIQSAVNWTLFLVIILVIFTVCQFGLLLALQARAAHVLWLLLRWAEARRQLTTPREEEEEEEDEIERQDIERAIIRLRSAVAAATPLPPSYSSLNLSSPPAAQENGS